MSKTDERERVALEPCPFCGANEEGFRLGKTGKPLVEELSEGGWRVTCYTCCYSIAQAIHPRGKFETAAAAVAAWNTRVDTRRETEVLREALEKLATSAMFAKDREFARAALTNTPKEEAND
jgi:hypothetical protein